MDQALDKILQVAHDFDINSYEDETYAAIEAMTGDGETPAEDQFGANGFDTLPLSDAIATAQLAQIPAFQVLHAAIKELHAQAVEKSKDEKQSADYRALHHAKGLGIEQVLGVIGSTLTESGARLQSTTPEERQAIGPKANQYLAELTEQVVGPPSAEVVRNTKAAQAFLATGTK